MVYLKLIKPGSKKLKFDDEWYPIAIVKKGKYDGYFLYLNTKIDENKGEKKINLPMGSTFEFIPNPLKMKRDVIYVAGASGSGKSYVAKQYIEKYRKLYPNKKIYLISALEADDTLDSIKGSPINRIPLDMVKNININKLVDCLFIFDDVDGVPDKEGGNDIQKLITNILIMGRAHTKDQGGVSIIIISHNLTNYKKSRLTLSESQTYVIFPHSTAATQLHYLLSKYLGFDRKDIRKLRDMNSRAIYLHKNYPLWMMGSHTVQLITDLDDEKK
jgi:Cdc6-like AAA superfamily ATPase